MGMLMLTVVFGIVAGVAVIIHGNREHSRKFPEVKDKSETFGSKLIQGMKEVVEYENAATKDEQVFYCQHTDTLLVRDNTNGVVYYNTGLDDCIRFTNDFKFLFPDVVNLGPL